MCCSTARHCWTLTTSTHPRSCEYTDIQPFAMHCFRRGRASLKSLCINFGGKVSTIATLMFAVLHMVLNSSTLSHQVMSDEAQEYWIIFMWINMQPLLQYTSPAHSCSIGCSHIKPLQQTTCANRCHCSAKSCSQFRMCYSIARHWRIHCWVISSLFMWILTLTNSHI